MIPSKAKSLQNYSYFLMSNQPSVPGSWCGDHCFLLQIESLSINEWCHMNSVMNVRTCGCPILILFKATSPNKAESAKLNPTERTGNGVLDRQVMDSDSSFRPFPSQALLSTDL